MPLSPPIRGGASGPEVLLLLLVSIGMALGQIDSAYEVPTYAEDCTAFCGAAECAFTSTGGFLFDITSELYGRVRWTRANCTNNLQTCVTTATDQAIAGNTEAACLVLPGEHVLTTSLTTPFATVDEAAPNFALLGVGGADNTTLKGQCLSCPMVRIASHEKRSVEGLKFDMLSLPSQPIMQWQNPSSGAGWNSASRALISSCTLVHPSLTVDAVTLSGSFQGTLRISDSTFDTAGPAVGASSTSTSPAKLQAVELVSCRFPSHIGGSSGANNGRVIQLKGAGGSLTAQDCIFERPDDGAIANGGADPTSTWTVAISNSRIDFTDGPFVRARNGQTLAVTLSNNTFRECGVIFEAQSASALGSLTMTDNSIFEPSDSAASIQGIACSGVTVTDGGGNIFCGSFFQTRLVDGTDCLSALENVTTDGVAPDGCGVCGGDNSEKDCSGECFGSASGPSCPTASAIWVSPLGSGVADGSSKANSLANISAALAQASHGDEVVLVEGTYSGAGNIGWKVPPGVTLRSEYRQPARTVIECGNCRADLSAVIQQTSVTARGQLAAGTPWSSWDTVVDGITLTGMGGSDEGSLAYFNNYQSPTLRRVAFRDAVGRYTVGARVANAYPRFDACSFVNLTSDGIGSSSRTVASAIEVNGNALPPLASPSVVAVTNSQFLQNQLAVNPITTFQGSTVTTRGYSTLSLAGCVFADNTASGPRPDANQNPAALEVQNPTITSGLGGRLEVIGTSFVDMDTFSNTISTGSWVACGSLPSDRVSQVNNTFCNTTGDASDLGGRSELWVACTDWPSPPPLGSVADACRVCDGQNAAQDCAGVCWGYSEIDPYGGCCLPQLKDCNNSCARTHTRDSSQTCCRTADIDCIGLCNGPARNDSFGTCCVDRALIDCTGRCNGTAVLDNSAPPACCASSNLLDCFGVCSGTAVLDINSTCCANSSLLDCLGQCEGPAVRDNFTTCCSSSGAIDCNGRCDGNWTRDPSLVCCSPSSKDACGVCFGTGSSCSTAATTTGSGSEGSNSPTASEPLELWLLIVIAAAVICCCCLLLVLAVFVFRSQSKGSQESSSSSSNSLSSQVEMKKGDGGDDGVVIYDAVGELVDDLSADSSDSSYGSSSQGINSEG